MRHNMFAVTAAAALAIISTSAQETTANWVTEHHDIRNSGLGDFTGPAEASAGCARSVITENPLDATQPRYYSTGVITEANEYMVIGNGANVLQIIEVETNAITTVNLTDVVNGTIIGHDGIVASGTIEEITVYDTIIYTTDRLFQGSSDGHCYAINVDACVDPDAVLRNLRYMEDVPGQPGLRRVNMKNYIEATAMHHGLEMPEEGSEVKDLRFLPCHPWLMTFQQPIHAPTRYIPADPANRFPAGIVLVSETHPNTDTQGVLHAMRADTGEYIWNFTARFVTHEGILKTSGIRYVPAVDPTGTGSGYATAYLAYGRVIIALDPYTGKPMGATSTVDYPRWTNTSDIFTSSPTLTVDGSRVYVHSATGTLWAHDITNVNGSVSFTPAWACDFFITEPTHICDNFTTTVHVARFDRESLRMVQKEVNRRDIVSGGFYQLTTKQDLLELGQELRKEWVARYTTPDMTPEQVEDVKEAADAMSVAELTTKLPISVVRSIVTPSGYTMLETDSQPSLHRLARSDFTDFAESGRDLIAQLRVSLSDNKPNPLTYGGVLPYATPSLSKNDANLYVAQYQVANGQSALFSVNPADGSQVWAFQNITSPVDGYVIPFGRSRSSPAVDQSGNIYVASDADEFEYTMPLLYALSEAGDLQWLVRVGTDNVLIGSASPVITQGYLGEKRLYMASGYNVIKVDEGIACPGQVDPFVFCSGNGVCNCTTGTCTCSNMCKTGPDCSTDVTCANGKCDPEKGCVCDPCFTGPNCDVPKDCGTNGQCNPTTGACECAGCFTGPNCQDTCNNHGTCTNNQCVCDKCSSGPGCSVVKNCNYGSCNTNTGTCDCQLCYTGDDCTTVNNYCGNEGLCYAGQGCICYPNYGPGGNQTCSPCPFCSQGVNCRDANLCGGHGTCVPATSSCACDPGFDPATGCTQCDECHGGISTGCKTVINTCSGHGVCVPGTGCVCNPGFGGPGCSVSTSGGGSDNSGGVAAGILIPLALVSVAGGLFFWKRKNPHKPWSALMPQWMASRVGVNASSYSNIGFSTSQQTPRDVRQRVPMSSTAYGTA